MAAFLVKAFLLTATVVNKLTNENVIVRLNQGGMIRGAVLRSEEGRPFYAFRGIPYAEPPTGQLRFKAPVVKRAWNDNIFDATKDGPVCVQLDKLVKKRLRGKEDCLTINVYTHQLPHEQGKSHRMHLKKPVMVFIHGGGFEMGDGTSETYNPSRLMDSNVVFVTLNYRLYTLGFLSTQDSSAPGNYGLLDQVLALRWVQENIELFGGDSKSITIFGESAGAASVSYHLLSPLSKGLFHRAIMMSGSALSPWAYVKNPLEWATFAANASGCPVDPTSALVDCLRSLPAYNLVGGRFGNTEIPLMLAFSPTVDGLFLTAPPHEILRMPEKINHVPVMSGVTTDEAAIFIWLMKENQKELGMNATVNPEDLINYVFLSALSNRKQHVVNMIKREYFSKVNQSNPRAIEHAIIDASSDGMFDVPHYEEVERLSEAGIPVYAYSYDYLAGLYEAFGMTREYGASHAEDLFMFFDIQWLGPMTLKAKDRRMAKTVKKLWTDFAYTGNPTPGNNNASPNWPPSSPGKINIYHIDQPFRVSEYDVLNDQRYHFWTKDVSAGRDER